MSEADASIRRILRYTITARYLGRQPMMVLYSVFGYATTLLALVAVLGFNFPILSAIGRTLSPDPQGPAVEPLAIASALPGWAQPLLALAAAAWIAALAYFRLKDGASKAPLARAVMNRMRAYEAELARIVEEPGAAQRVELLDKLYSRVYPLSDQAIQDGYWPESWRPFKDGVDEEVRSTMLTLYERHPHLGTVAAEAQTRVESVQQRPKGSLRPAS
jgi:hypothetical protein